MSVESKHGGISSEIDGAYYTSYLSPIDAGLPRLSVPTEHYTAAIAKAADDNMNGLEVDIRELAQVAVSMTSVRDLALTAAGISITKSHAQAPPSIIIFPLAKSIVYPSKFPLPHTNRIVENQLFEDEIFFTVYSKEGYNFTSEFLHAYKGKSDKKTTLYTDILIVIQRALLIADHALDMEALVALSAHILRLASWELSIVQETSYLTVRSAFKEILPEISMKQRKLKYGKLFIGKNPATGQLEFWIRVATDFNVVLKGVGAMTAEEAECLSECQTVYYRRYGLVLQEILSKIEEESSRGGSSSQPLPPPRTPPSEDAMVYFLVAQRRMSPSQMGANNANQTTLLPYWSSMNYFDDDDDNVDNTASYQAQNNTISSAIDVTSKGKLSSGSTLQLDYPAVSLCTELVGWGNNSSKSLGFADGSSNYEPRIVPITPRLRIEGVKIIACSARHTLLLSGFGIVYGCGENSEGALGTGDMVTRSSFAPVYWSTADYKSSSLGSPPLISHIAAGSASIGSHSMAIDEQGTLYGWGVPYAIGMGSIKPVLHPQPVPFTHISLELDIIHAASGRPENIAEPEAADGNAATGDKRFKCKDVSCGGGFTVAILENGLACSFGLWAYGRLGLGSIPIVDSRRYGRNAGGRKAARFQLRPAVIPIPKSGTGCQKVCKVSCGEAHAMCLLESGELLAWGQNSSGQLGIGVTLSGYLRDSLLPIPVAPFFSHANHQQKQNNQKSFRRVVSIETGAYHSLALDEHGACWSWGARGSACLGHGDGLLEGIWGQRVNTIFSSTSGRVMIPHEILSWCQSWSKPRIIDRFPGHLVSADGSNEFESLHLKIPVHIVAMSAGDMHSTFLTAQGHVFLCGTGPVVPPLLPTSRMEELLNDESKESSSNEDASSNWKSVLSSYTVTTPRRPSASWLPAFCSRRHVVIASGGMRCFAVVDDENISTTLSMPLIDKLIYDKNSSGSVSGRSNASQTETASLSQSSILDSHGNHSAGYFESRGKADCIIVTSGKLLAAHRAVLAQRSPELRDMIIMETPTVYKNNGDDLVSLGSEGGLQSLVQILLPEFHIDAAKALLYFLYCDVLPVDCVGNISLLQSLVRAGKSLRIPRLQLLCEHLISVLIDMEIAAIGPDDDNITSSPSSSMNRNLELPPVTLARDLGSLVGDPQFADVRFVAEGRAIYAHRFILESRCEYFRAMFRSGMMETQMNDQFGAFGEAVDVVVPDSFIGFLRLLLFIYTDTLPDASDDALLEDLISADRYHLDDMRVLCESMLIPSEENWQDILYSADLINSLTLKRDVMRFLQSNFSIITSLQHNNITETGDSNSVGELAPMQELTERYPSLFEDILALRMESTLRPPSQLYTKKIADNSLEEDVSRTQTFPIWALGTLAVALYLYNKFASVIALGYLVPVVNVLFLAGLAFFLMKKLEKD